MAQPSVEPPLRNIEAKAAAAKPVAYRPEHVVGDPGILPVLAPGETRNHQGLIGILWTGWVGRI
jgi:hypothetical protein